GGPALGRLKNRSWRSGRRRFEQDPTSLRTSQTPAAMASKGLQDLTQQVEGAAQEAGTRKDAHPDQPGNDALREVSHVSVLVTAAGAATQQVVDETTETGQKAMDQVAKSTQETIDKTANQASEAFSGLGKILRLLK
ncbi:hypothetical protein EI555_019364, partial [Monodon monoceros]